MDFTNEQRAYLDRLYLEWVDAITTALVPQSDNAQRKDLKLAGLQLAFQITVRALLSAGAEPLSIIETVQRTIAETDDEATYN